MRPLACNVVLLLFAAPVLAGVPGPDRSGCFPNQNPCVGRSSVEVTGQGPCQFRFRPDGGLDRLTVKITLRDAFDNPSPGCSTSTSVIANAGTISLCGCCPMRQVGFSDAAGALEFVFPSIGGRGSLDVVVTAYCSGSVEFGRESFDFTSTDLDGSCEPDVATTVLDLAIWAHCLPPSPYCEISDYDCSGAVGLIDLAYWAGGLVVGCNSAPCP